MCAARAGVRSHSAKRSLAGPLIAKSARRRRDIAMQTAGSGPHSPSTSISTTLLVTGSGHPGNLVLRVCRCPDLRGDGRILPLYRERHGQRSQGHEQLAGRIQLDRRPPSGRARHVQHASECEGRAARSDRCDAGRHRRPVALRTDRIAAILN